MSVLKLVWRAFMSVFLIAPAVWIRYGIEKNQTIHVLGGVMLLLFFPVLGLALFGGQYE